MRQRAINKSIDTKSCSSSLSLPPLLEPHQTHEKWEKFIHEIKIATAKERERGERRKEFSVQQRM
jgi:hypothetical protein